MSSFAAGWRGSAGRCPPGAMAAFQRALAEIDARPLLPLIQAPTLILHRRNSAFVPYSHGQYLADHIAGAKLVELPGTESTIVWETPQLALGHIEEFLTGARHGARPRQGPGDRAVHRHRRLDRTGRPSWATAAGASC